MFLVRWEDVILCKGVLETGGIFLYSGFSIPILPGGLSRRAIKFRGGAFLYKPDIYIHGCFEVAFSGEFLMLHKKKKEIHFSFLDIQVYAKITSFTLLLAILQTHFCL